MNAPSWREQREARERRAEISARHDDAYCAMERAEVAYERAQQRYRRLDKAYRLALQREDAVEARVVAAIQGASR